MTDAERVTDYMEQLQHPLKPEINAVRAIIKMANKKIAERIKWNAPSFYYKEDLATIHVKATKLVHLIFHNAAIVKIKSPLLQGEYKDRRMVYFTGMAAIKTNKKELGRIVNELVQLMDV